MSKLEETLQKKESFSSVEEERFIPFCAPTIEDEEIAEVLETLKSGWITTGKKVLKFEEMFKERLNASHAISVNSATSAWQLVAKAIGIGPGDEVIIPAITWPSVANVVELLGATCVFADVDPISLQVLPESIASLVSERTKAIIPVHFAGAPFDIDAVKSIIDGKGIYLIEDAAHAIGTCYKGVEIGSSNSITIFSFHPIKNITTGEGGMIICNDDDLAERIRRLRFHGISKDAWKRYAKGGSPEYEVLEPGYKFNMMDLQAALGIAQFPKLDRFNERRSEIAALYTKSLVGVDGINLLVNDAYDHVHTWHLYIIQLDLAKLKIDRNEFILLLGERNIGAGLHFPAIHLMSYYKEKYKYTPTDLPNATKMGKSILSLPIFPSMKDEDVKRVARVVKEVFNDNLIKEIES